VKRIQTTPRTDWQARIRDAGMVWAGADTGGWNESAYYSFTNEDIERIGEATADLYRLFIHCGDAMLDYRDFYWLRQMGMPEWLFPYLKAAWDAEPPALNFGRFDLGFDGRNDPKLFEFNCDTPGSLIEASLAQAIWREDLFPRGDQFNGINRALVSRWADLRTSFYGRTFHMTHVFDEDGEDTAITNYLAETARMAGLDPMMVVIDDIGQDEEGRFVDADDILMDVVYKHYPWEWIVREEYGRAIVEQSSDPMLWIEPIWKMLWSNKGILVVAKALEPENPYLLNASFGDTGAKDFVKKPIFSRRGENIEIVDQRQTSARSTGGYGAEGFVYQEKFDLPEMAPGIFPVIDSWIVGGVAVGMGVREGGLITDSSAAFVPHIIEG
jgi:glutathionylspermidine synthase